MVYIHWCTQFHKTKTTENKEIDSDTIKVKNLILDSVNKYIIQAKKNKIKKVNLVDMLYHTANGHKTRLKTVQSNDRPWNFLQNRSHF
jgi:hypothetical protein